MKQVTRGNEMMLFLDGQSLALATSHTLTVTADTIDISTKDHGYWGASDIGNMSFEITSEIMSEGQTKQSVLLRSFVLYD